MSILFWAHNTPISTFTPTYLATAKYSQFGQYLAMKVARCPCYVRLSMAFTHAMMKDHLRITLASLIHGTGTSQ